MRAALDWTLAHDDPDLGLRIMGAIWRWFQQRGRLREARALLAELLGRPRRTDVLVRIAALAAEGGLAYWMNDFAAAAAAYNERLDLASSDRRRRAPGRRALRSRLPVMVSQDAEALREHEQRALELYQAAGSEAGAVRARQALVLAVFLAGDYARARDLERRNLEAFQRAGSPAPGRRQPDAPVGRLLAAGRPGASPGIACPRRSSCFVANDNASGLARALGMAAIVLLNDGDAELGARVAGATYALVREKGVMLAPVKVLHLPDPARRRPSAGRRAGRRAHGRRRTGARGRDGCAGQGHAAARVGGPGDDRRLRVA